MKTAEEILFELRESASQIESIMVAMKECSELIEFKNEINMKMANSVAFLSEAQFLIFLKYPNLTPDYLKDIDFSKYKE